MPSGSGGGAERSGVCVWGGGVGVGGGDKKKDIPAAVSSRDRSLNLVRVWISSL